MGLRSAVVRDLRASWFCGRVARSCVSADCTIAGVRVYIYIYVGDDAEHYVSKAASLSDVCTHAHVCTDTRDVCTSIMIDSDLRL